MASRSSSRGGLASASLRRLRRVLGASMKPPLRYLAAIAAFGLLLGVSWWRSGGVRSVAVLEIPAAPDEQVAILRLLEIALDSAEVRRAGAALLPGHGAGDLRGRITLARGTEGVVEVVVDLPDRVPPGDFYPTIIRVADEWVRKALPGLREERIEVLQERLDVLERALRRRGGAAANLSGGRAVLEVQRDELARTLDRWRLREWVHGKTLRLLSREFRSRRFRDDGTSYLHYLGALAMLFAVLEGLGIAVRQESVLRAPRVAPGPDEIPPATGPGREDEARRPYRLELPPAVMEWFLSNRHAGSEATPHPRVPEPASAPAASEGLPFRLLGDLDFVDGLVDLPASGLRAAETAGGGLPPPFPSLAAKLDLLKPRWRRMLVVGWTQGCGATYVAVNLARVVARLGRRTVLVDGNLRRPRLHAVYGVRNDEGFVDSLLDSDPAEITHAVEPPGLSLLGSGPRPPVAEELLAAARLGASLDRLDLEYDRVVIDGAPLHDGADSLLLAAHVDGVVVVVPSHVQVPELGLHLGELEDLGIPLVGVVVGAL